MDDSPEYLLVGGWVEPGVLFLLKFSRILLNQMCFHFGSFVTLHEFLMTDRGGPFIN